MGLILRLAWRETRAQPWRYVFFLLSVAIGVAALVAVRSFGLSLEGALHREARQLLAADLQVSLSRPATATEAAELAAVVQAGGQVGQVTELVSMAAANTGAATSVVEVKAVEPGKYPFYGVLEVDPPGAALTAGTALVGADLLPRLGLRVGDGLRLGEATFAVAGVIRKEPDRIAAGFGIGPRVLITQAGLQTAGLVTTGSRARHIYLIQAPAGGDIEALRQSLVPPFKATQVRGVRESQPQIRRFLDRLTGFLALVALVALVAGGFGVAHTTRAFLQQKLDTVAILKCLGAPIRTVVAVYLVQAVALGLLGGLVGAGLGLVAQAALPPLLGPLLDLDIQLAISPWPVVQGMLSGMLVAGLFALVPLLSVGRIPPALVLRRDMDEAGAAGRRLHRDEVAAALFAAVVLGLMAAWQSGSWLWGLYFFGGLMAAIATLGAFAWLSLWALRRAPALPRAAWRYGLGNLFRPGNQALAVVLALGLGVTAVTAVYLLGAGLLNQVRRSTPAGAPNLVLIGIPADRARNLEAFLQQHQAVQRVAEFTPIVLARLLTVDGRGPEQLGLEEGDVRFFNRQWSLTWSANVPTGDTVVAGRWWQPGPPPPIAPSGAAPSATSAGDSAPAVAAISVEEEAAQRLHVGIGSELVFEVDGQPVRGRVESLRRVDWGRISTNFLVVFAPGTLEAFGQSYAALVRTDPARQPALLRELVDGFPGVTALDIADILDTVGTVLDRVALVIQFIAAFAIAAGLMILIGAVAATRFRRAREAAVLRTLGATPSVMAQALGIEHAVTGFLAGAVGVVLAHIGAGILTVTVFELQPVISWPLLVATPFATALLTVLTGTIAAWDLLHQKPLVVLRGE